jgi:hypothetical protein
MLKQYVHLWFQPIEKEKKLPAQRVDCGSVVGWETPDFDAYLKQKIEALNHGQPGPYFIGDLKGNVIEL